MRMEDRMNREKMLMGGDRIPTNKSDHELNEQALQENQQYVQKHIPAFKYSHMGNMDWFDAIQSERQPLSW